MLIFAGVTRLVIIPEAAYDVKVEIILPPELLFENTNFTLVMKDRRRERYKVLDSNYKMNFKPVAVEGALFYGQKIDNTIALWTKGPTLGEIIISVCFSWFFDLFAYKIFYSFSK